jgi:hypothetical protein
MVRRSVRTDGDWEAWTAFFLESVATSSEEAVRDTLTQVDVGK